MLLALHFPSTLVRLLALYTDSLRAAVRGLNFAKVTSWAHELAPRVPHLRRKVELVNEVLAILRELCYSAPRVSEDIVRTRY